MNVFADAVPPAKRPRTAEDIVDVAAAQATDVVARATAKTTASVELAKRPEPATVDDAFGRKVTRLPQVWTAKPTTSVELAEHRPDAASVDDAFGSSARDAADEAAVSEAAGATTQPRSSLAARHATAERLRSEGEAAATSGDFTSALEKWDNALCELRVYTQATGDSAVAAQAVSVCAEDSVAALTADESKSRRLYASVQEAIAQVLLVLPDRDFDVHAPTGLGEFTGSGGSSTVRKAVCAAEKAAAADPEWAPAQLTLGRALLALGEASRAVFAFKVSKSQDYTLFDSEGGEDDLQDALILAEAQAARRALALKGPSRVEPERARSETKAGVESDDGVLRSPAVNEALATHDPWC